MNIVKQCKTRLCTNAMRENEKHKYMDACIYIRNTIFRSQSYIATV